LDILFQEYQVVIVDAAAFLSFKNPNELSGPSGEEIGLEAVDPARGFFGIRDMVCKGQREKTDEASTMRISPRANIFLKSVRALLLLWS
jgi:hypothetical protein